MNHPPHNLAIDIGNSGLRLSLLDVERQGVGEPLRINWSHGCREQVTALSSVGSESRSLADRFPPDSEDWFPIVDQWLAQQELAQQSLAQHTASEAATWLISSVRGDATARLTEFIQRRPGDVPRVIGFRDVPMQVEVDLPERLGIDRLLAAFAAAATNDARPLIVIQAGSAVTIDLVTRIADGGDTFAGGAILPGVPMMLRLLGRGADMLPEIDADDLIELPPLPGKNTEAAMLCGTSSALVGGIQHLVGRYRDAFGPDTPVVISGGDGMRLSPYLAPPVRVQDHLVQRGLLRLLPRS